jgi:radical SAM protein with 4Fe4S-binding SPASM domain
MSKIGARYISFTGGEPLLRDDLPALIREAKKIGLMVSLVSNGFYFYKYEYLFKERLIDSIQISLESDMKEINDSIRGEGVFDVVTKQAIPIVHNYNVPFTIAVTPTPINSASLDGLAELAYSLGARALVIRRFLATGNALGSDEGVFKDNIAHKNFLQQIYRLKREMADKIEIRSSDPLYSIVDPDLVKFKDSNVLGGCSAGVTSCSVNINGDFKICTRIPKVLGNVLHDDLADLWKNNEELKKIRNRLNLEGKCGKCDYKWICGGCRGVAFRESQNILGEDNQCWI